MVTSYAHYKLYYAKDTLFFYPSYDLECLFILVLFLQLIIGG